MNYILRKMHVDDTESIWTLFQGIKAEKIDMSFAEITQKEEILAFVDNPSELTYVAILEEDPHEVLCIVKARREMTVEKKHAAFLSAATRPHFRGNGLVAKLTEFALKEMKDEGVNIARIYVYSNNCASINAIKKLNFIHAGTVLKHHKDIITGEYIDDLIFHKILD
ncbi:MAG: GNAT family N-acetyltransferase [Eubacteriales bacterium]|nr:GNAT family N-acetyltransferase [Eubacteriales bacterium]